MIKTVIFDLDNTLCDTIAAIKPSMKACYKYLKNFYPELDLEKFLSCEEQVFFRLTLDEGLPVYSFRAIYWHEIFKEVGLEINPILIKDVALLYQDQLAKNVELFDGVRDLLDSLKGKDLSLNILSNGDYVTKVTMIQYLNIKDYFDQIVASDLTQADKPDLKAFSYIPSKLNVSFSECLMIGDEKRNDVEGAISSGMNAIYATWPQKNEGKVLEGVFCAEKPKDVLKYLESRNQKSQN